MFNRLVKQILEGYNVFPRAKIPMGSGPNVNFTGPTPTGFLGGGLPGINPTSNVLVVRPKKKKKKLKKRV